MYPRERPRPSPHSAPGSKYRRTLDGLHLKRDAVQISFRHVTTKVVLLEPHPRGNQLFDDAVLDVGDAGRLDRPHLLESELAHVLEQPLAGAQQDWDDVELK